MKEIEIISYITPLMDIINPLELEEYMPFEIFSKSRMYKELKELEHLWFQAFQQIDYDTKL